MKSNASSSRRLPKPIAIAITTLATALIAIVGLSRPAHADIGAAYVEGYGGLSSPQTDAMPSGASALSPALGLQVGARLLALELYGDYTSLGSGTSVERAILGLRTGIGARDVRLELRVGGGAISEHGGALTGTLAGTEDRTGVVARAGIDVEKKIARTLLMGFGVDGEVFSVAPPSSGLQPGGWTSGSDILASLHLKFELGL